MDRAVCRRFPRWVGDPEQADIMGFVLDKGTVTHCKQDNNPAFEIVSFPCLVENGSVYKVPFAITH